MNDRSGPFSPTSRYYGVAVARYTRADGTVIAYVLRRYIRAPDGYATLRTHAVTQGERIDTIAASELGDAESYWRICDANGVLDPAELEAPGTRVRITLPAGIPGSSND